MAIKTWSENNPPKNLCCPPPPPSNVSALLITYTPSNPSAWTSPIPSNVQQALDSLANRPAGGELSGTYPNPILVNSAVTGKILTGLAIVNSTIIPSDSILTAIGKLQGQITALSTAPLSLTNGNIFVGDITNTAQEVIVNGEATLTNAGLLTLDNNAVIEKVLSTFVLLTGSISPTDSIVDAFGKLQNAVNNSISSSLLDGRILIGNASNIATQVLPSGEANIANNGVITLNNTAVITKILTGLTFTNAQITATDDILTAFGKLQSQLNNNVGYVLTNGTFWLGDSGNLPVERVMSGEATLNNLGALTLNNNAVISKVLTGFAIQTGAISATDSILQAFGKIQNALNNSLTTTLTSGQIIVGNASNIATPSIMSGEATIDNAAVVTLSNTAVINKILTSFALLSGSISPTDTIVQAFGKLQNSINNSQSTTLGDNQFLIGNASNIATPQTLSGELTTTNAGVVSLSNLAVISKILTGLSLTNSPILATDSILIAFGKLQGQLNNNVGSSLTNGRIWIGDASNLPIERVLSGEATVDNLGSIALSNLAVISKVLTGFLVQSGVVTSADSIVTAIGKLQNGINNSLTTTLASGQIIVGNASNVATAVIASGEASIDNTGLVTLTNNAVINKILNGFTVGTGAIVATDSILQAFGKAQGQINSIISNYLTNSLNNGQILIGNASNIATPVTPSGEATVANSGVITLSNSAIISKVLTGFALQSGIITATDTILQAFGKVQNALNNSLSTTLANGRILIGNVSNIATPVLPSGEASIANTGNIILDNNSVLAKEIPSPFTPVIASIAANDSIKTAFEKTQGQLDNTVNEWVSPPPTSTTTGTQGQKAFDTNYVYFCVLNNTWVRVSRDLTIW